MYIINVSYIMDNISPSWSTSRSRRKKTKPYKAPAMLTLLLRRLGQLGKRTVKCECCRACATLCGDRVCRTSKRWWDASFPLCNERFLCVKAFVCKNVIVSKLPCATASLCRSFCARALPVCKTYSCVRLLCVKTSVRKRVCVQKRLCCPTCACKNFQHLCVKPALCKSMCV